MQHGAEFTYDDEFVPALPALELDSVGLETGFEQADCAVLLTAHPGIDYPALDYPALAERAPLLIDFRGITRGQRAENLVRL